VEASGISLITNDGLMTLIGFVIATVTNTLGCTGDFSIDYPGIQITSGGNFLLEALF
jgi:hypothetical protein